MKKIITIILALLMTFTLPARGREDRSWNIKSSRDSVEESETMTFTEGETLTVDLRTGGSLKIIGTDSELAEIDIVRKGDAIDEAKLTIEERGQGLTIESKYFNNRGGSGGIDLIVKLNRKAFLKIETMGGNVELENISGEFTGKTLGGDIIFRGLKGDVDFQTLGGDILIKDSQLDGNVHTLGGDIKIIRNLGALDANTLGGKVTIEDSVTTEKEETGQSGDKPVVMDSLGGDIKVDSAPAGIVAKTLGGDIFVKEAVQYARVETLGGDIILERVDGYIEAQTLGGNVQAEMTGDSSEKNRDVIMSSLGGYVMLTVPDDLDMTVEITIEVTKNARKNYKIITDFNLDINEREPTENENHRGIKSVITATGTTGNGSNKITLSTINGNINLEKK